MGYSPDTSMRTTKPNKNSVLDGKIQPQYFNAEHKTKQEQRLAYADPLTPQP